MRHQLGAFRTTCRRPAKHAEVQRSPQPARPATLARPASEPLRDAFHIDWSSREESNQ